MITQDKSGFHVKSEHGKNLGGPYKTREEAVHRLQTVEYFKHRDKTASLKELGFSKTALSPELLRKASDVAAKAAEQQRSNFAVLRSMSEQPGAPKKLHDVAVDTMNVARKKSSQSIKFLGGAMDSFNKTALSPKTVVSALNKSRREAVSTYNTLSNAPNPSLSFIHKAGRIAERRFLQYQNLVKLTKENSNYIKKIKDFNKVEDISDKLLGQNLLAGLEKNLNAVKKHLNTLNFINNSGNSLN